MKIKMPGIIISFYMIIANVYYLRINTNNYSMKKLFILTLGIIISDLLFWSFFNATLKKKHLIMFFFIIFLVLVDTDRMAVQLFTSYNDKLLSSFIFANIIGGIRLIYLFISIYFFFFLSDTKNWILRAIGLLNIVTAILIFVEFDSAYAPFIRIFIAMLYVIYLLIFNNKKIITEEISQMEMNNEVNENDSPN